MKKTGYNGNENLKKVNTPVGYTADQVKEFVKCSQDPLYFIKKYIKIVHVDHGLVPFKTWEFQDKLIKTIYENRFSIHKLSRQIGKTTCTAAIMLWYVLFNKFYKIAILAHKLEGACEVLSRVKLAFENLPKWLQQGVVSWNEGDIELENGSSIFAAATSGSAVRGKSINLVYLDEFAFVPFNLQEEFYRSTMPTISSGNTTKVVITSTPNGMDLFYKIWHDAINKKSRFVAYQAGWRDVPGRGEAWKAEQLKDMTERQFDIEYEAEFIGSSNTLIDPRKLAALASLDPVYNTDDFSMNVYEMPIPGHMYVMTVDSSEGLGQDNHAFTVIDVTRMPYKVVCTYRNNAISALILPTYIMDTAIKYNHAHVLIESQSQGQQVASILYQDLEYENVLMTSAQGRAGQVITDGFAAGQRFGVHMSAQVKTLGCSNLKTLIESDKLLVNDFGTIQELYSFTQQKRTYKAEEGKHDDSVMTLVMFAWLTTLQWFKDVTDINVREHILAQSQRKIEEQLLPFGFISDGFDDFDDDNWL
jgi:hypothetical protein